MMAFEKMRVLKLRCVISTDLMSRGVDLPDVQIVINLDLPQHRTKDQMGISHGWPELVHRIGRAGRFGSPAMAINFVRKDDLKSQGGHESMEIADFATKSVEELADLIKTQIGSTSSVNPDEIQSKSRVQNRLAKEQNLLRRNDEL